MITPAFGLSRDYDDFILGCAPQLITLCIAASFNQGGFYLEFIGVLEEILEKINVCWAGLNCAIYSLHISSAINHENLFNKAKTYLLNYKALSEDNIFMPPSCVSVMEGDFDDYFKKGELTEIPEMNRFAMECIERFQKEQVNMEAIVLRALDDDSYIYEWSNELLEALWSKIADKDCGGLVTECSK
jgi:hypothetical protein